MSETTLAPHDSSDDIPRPGVIGVFDSGVGGLSILRPLREMLPAHDVVFVADQARVPYGPRPLDEVRRFSVGITRVLLDLGTDVVVVACNTASAAALQHLRKTFPDTPFVGMEPAVKPAAALTKTRTVGVLATPATFQGALFASVVERFAQGVTVLERTLPGLVERIEAGDLDSRETRRIVRHGVRPLIDQGADTLVLACTHYPFVIELIAAEAGPGVEVINPALAIARQTKRVIAGAGCLSPTERQGDVKLLTSGDPLVLTAMALRLAAIDTPAAHLVWGDDVGT